jgi:tRNA-Thr(GGU) m(6)t(6)A37 methyltransferase TsaA
MDVTLRVIGVVRNGRHDPADRGWGQVESAIELEHEFASGLDGLAEQWSHVLVMFWMHRDPDGEPAPADWRRRPRGRADLQLLGVFAQRGRLRPNVLGVTAVPIVRVERGRLVVRGLDAVDGTPVLDLKPYAPVFDRVDDARVPEWFEAMMPGYF